MTTYQPGSFIIVPNWLLAPPSNGPQIPHRLLPTSCNFEFREWCRKKKMILPSIKDFDKELMNTHSKTYSSATAFKRKIADRWRPIRAALGDALEVPDVVADIILVYIKGFDGVYFSTGEVVLYQPTPDTVVGAFQDYRIWGHCTGTHIAFHQYKPQYAYNDKSLFWLRHSHTCWGSLSDDGMDLNLEVLYTEHSHNQIPQKLMLSKCASMYQQALSFAREGNLSKLVELVNRGFDINMSKREAQDKTCLICALESEQPHIVQYIVDLNEKEYVAANRSNSTTNFINSLV